MIFKLFFLLFIVTGLFSCSNEGALEACTARGVEYFKEIGSYPRLESPPNVGRSAEEVARERCDRTTTAF